MVLESLADPTRRNILELVCGKPSSVQELADQLPVSRPGGSHHLKTLRAAAIVPPRPAGARRVYTISTDGFDVLRQWLDVMWRDALEAFATYCETQPDHPGGTK